MIVAIIRIIFSKITNKGMVIKTLAMLILSEVDTIFSFSCNGDALLSFWS